MIKRSWEEKTIRLGLSIHTVHNYEGKLEKKEQEGIPIIRSLDQFAYTLTTALPTIDAY